MEEVFPLERELNIFDPARIHLYRDDFEDLVLEQEEGDVHRGVQVLRGFPLSAENRFISVKDGEEKELGIIGDITELDAESRKVLEEELKRVYFVPRITHVNQFEERFHIPRWDVETDRGPRIFEIRSGRNDVRVMDKGRILIRDADGNQYEIPDYRRLDLDSQNLIESQI